MRRATCVIVQTHQILRLPRKMTVQNLREICWKRMKRHFQCAADPSMIREWSELKPSVRNPPRNRGYFSRPPRAFCIEKYNASRSGYHSEFHRILRLPRKVTLQLHQILRLPRKVTLIIDPLHTWNAIYNARSNKCHCPNSPNTAPATKNESHDWSLSQMKRYLQCAEQHVSLSKLTKYCACHEKWFPWLILVTHETLFTMRRACVIVQTHQILRLPRKMAVQNLREICWKRMKRHFQCAADPSMIREWSDHETVSPQPASQPRLLFTPTTSILYWKIQHFALRLSFQISPNTAPATKSDTSTSPNTAPATKSDTWTSPNTAPATKSDTWTSPSTAPAMKSDTWTSANRAITWLSYYLTELLLDWAMTWLSYYLTELLLDWAITWLSHDLTELWLDWAITWLSYDLTELLLDWAITWLSYDLTELWLDWAMTWLSYYLTELLLDWAMTWLSYYSAILFVYRKFLNLNFLRSCIT